MSNPHIVSVSDLNETDPAWALVEATLALAFEARTANLIAAYTYGIVGPSNESVDESTIITRLGLRDTK